VDTAYIVLIALCIIYVPIWFWVWRKPEEAARYHLNKYGPAIMIRTRLGMKAMDRLSRYKRFWRAFGLLSKVLSLVLLCLMLYMLIVAVLNLPAALSSSSSVGIRYALAIPGFNPMLPLSYGVLALCVAMVVHEMGHGIQTRANGAKVDSTGLLYAVVPVGAFVEPNEEEMRQQPRRVQMDMYTAGISVNTVLAVICMALMVFSFTAVSTDHGEDVGVFSVDGGSPMYEAGIPVSSLIVGIYDADGNPVPYGTKTVSTSVFFVDYEDTMFDPMSTYTVEYIYHDTTDRIEGVQLGAFIQGVVKDGPAYNSGMRAGELLYSLTTSSGEHRVGTWDDFTNVMSGTLPGETVTVTTATVAKEGYPAVRNSYEVVLGQKGDIGYLGISTDDCGLRMMTPNVLKEMAVNPFYNCETPIDYVKGLFSYLSGPFNGMDPMPNATEWWYDVPGGSLFWVLMSCLYWIFWLDLLLAITNALPAYPFDGGYIFAGGVSWVLEKMRVGDEERRKAMTESIARSVSTIALLMFILVFVAVII
jgi:membrane-associated protease RseP (regulator of RpoE activity)